MDKELVKEKHFLRVFSSSKIKDEKPRFLDDATILYCALDNHKCDGSCRQVNTDRHGCLYCSEVITDEFIAKKRRTRKRFKPDHAMRGKDREKRRESEEDF